MNTRRRASVNTIAETNPGDGSKRMYGDTSFILDGSDIEGVHPDVIRGVEKKKGKKATVEDVEDEDDSSMTYLEDTEARGYTNVLTIAACTYHLFSGPLLPPFAGCLMRTIKTLCSDI